ncbi:MAG: HNH endonuclease signature motif containing protein, partial [Trebonia sp.]
RNPLDRLKLQDPATPQPAALAPGGTDPDAWPGWGTDDAGDPEDFRCDDPLTDDAGDPARSRPAPGPMPAQINLIVPIGTLLGWSTAPALAGAWGLLDSDETRTIVGAAARHPCTRWCATLIAPDGTALAHACARGQHPRLLSDLGPQPPPAQIADLLRRLNLTFTPIATGTCDHTQAEGHYTPSRKLKHLIRARTTTCDAPGCQAQAISADLDHTTPWPDGPTDQCNLAPRCRTHHRAKQAPDWKLEQPEPGLTRWVLPSGRTHKTTPTSYDT